MPTQQILSALNASTTSDATGNAISGSSSSGGVEIDTTNGAVVPVVLPKKKLVVIEKIEPTSSAFYERNSTSYSDHFEADMICLHYSAARYYPSLNAINGLYAGDVSSHFFLSRSGRIVQIVDLGKAAHTQGSTDANSANSASDIVKERGINPNQYCYSIECESKDIDMGGLSPEQIKGAVFNMRYIRDNSDNRINFTRMWEGFPELPSLRSKGEAVSYKDAEGNIESTVYLDQRRYNHVRGQILGHNDISRSEFCPGSKFPWISILTKLGIYPDINEDIYDPLMAEKDYFLRCGVLKNKSNYYYNTVAPYKEQLDAYIANTPSTARGGLNWDIIEDAIGPKPADLTVPFYTNPKHAEEEIEFVVWKRKQSEVTLTDSVESILPNLRKYLEGKEKDASNEFISVPYEKESYEVMLYE